MGLFIVVVVKDRVVRLSLINLVVCVVFLVGFIFWGVRLGVDVVFGKFFKFFFKKVRL